jgi:hypothetical protein
MKKTTKDHQFSRLQTTQHPLFLSTVYDDRHHNLPHRAWQLGK